MKRQTYILILFIFSVVALGSFFCTNNKDIQNVAIAIFSSGLFALFIETGNYLYDINQFGYLRGKWIRNKFFHRNGKTTEIGYDDLTERYNQNNINPNISLEYKGDGQYHGNAFYEEGTKTFILLLNKNNALSGNGTYQCQVTNSQKSLPDIGQFEFIVDVNKNIIYISHENKLPNGTSRGTEIWRKK
ncbi:MAG: hypothetical protein ACK40G_18160 [Cytophagaceae bacterium]